MSYNNRGNYEQGRGNFNRNGNGNRNGNSRTSYDDNKYLNPSSTKKFIHYNDDIDQATGKPHKQRVSFSEAETEEISFSLTPEKVQDFIAKLQAAAEDNTGTGGAYISMYCKKSENKRTGEVFDGINILINKQNQPDPRFARGNFKGKQGGGRRDFGQADTRSDRPATRPPTASTERAPTTRYENNTGLTEPEF